MDKRSYNKRQVGTEKENLAAEYLKKKGYFIIEKNYRVRQGEIDLIARDSTCIVFVEVKYRANGRSGDALEAHCIKFKDTGGHGSHASSFS